MDAETIIQTLRSGVKDKTLNVRFYNLHNGTDIWIDGLDWMCRDFDMAKYLKECFDVEIEGLMYDVLESDDDFINKTCFIKGQTSARIFSSTKYDEVQQALDKFDEGAISAAIILGISLDKMETALEGSYESFRDFVEQRFDDLYSSEIPGQFRLFIDYEKVAESWRHDYNFQDGYVFNANY